MKNADMPAMPITNHDLAVAIGNGDNKFGGLTKREMFAMSAMQGLLAANSGWTANVNPMTNGEIASEAVFIADELLGQLEN